MGKKTSLRPILVKIIIQRIKKNPEFPSVCGRKEKGYLEINKIQIV
jgi:hypothetical protein